MSYLQDHKGDTQQMKGDASRSLEHRDGGEHKLVKEEAQTQRTSPSLPEAERALLEIKAEQPGKESQQEWDGDSAGDRLAWETNEEEKPNLDVSEELGLSRVITERPPWCPVNGEMSGNRHIAGIEPRNAPGKQDSSFVPHWRAAKQFGDANEGRILKCEPQNSYLVGTVKLGT
ncbi:UNVERIFIED_CONTAM: hypothetical protein K2H54_062583 [Gekko kuhli]